MRVLTVPPPDGPDLTGGRGSRCVFCGLVADDGVRVTSSRRHGGAGRGGRGPQTLVPASPPAPAEESGGPVLSVDSGLLVSGPGRVLVLDCGLVPVHVLARARVLERGPLVVGVVAAPQGGHALVVEAAGPPEQRTERHRG